MCWTEPPRLLTGNWIDSDPSTGSLGGYSTVIISLPYINIYLVFLHLVHRNIRNTLKMKHVLEFGPIGLPQSLDVIALPKNDLKARIS